MIEAIVRADDSNTRKGDAEYVLAPDVLLLRIQVGTARLLDFNGHFYALSQTGASILCETLSGGSAAAARCIAAAYGADLQQVQHDTDLFLHDLERRQLVYCPGKAPDAHRGQGAMPWLVLLPVLHCIYALPIALRARV
jgi:Coenzyme PQQ synthesis protein D (PqqD)